MKSGSKDHLSKAKVVDLFCGIGGLSHGLRLAGFKIAAGVDNDKSCRVAFEKNNKAKFIAKDIKDVTATEIAEQFGDAETRILVGCAPCQPFSKLNKKRRTKQDLRRHWYPLYRFLDLIEELEPEIVSMENVPDLSKPGMYPVFEDFIKTLRRLKYHVSHGVVDASLYGVPQRRRRLVLLASKFGKISMKPPTNTGENARTVRQAIKGLPRLKAGSKNRKDPLHRASVLSDLNKKRIESTPRNGGGAKSWEKALVPKCYRRKTGRTYMCSVYSRMHWDTPSPTITTLCTHLGTGRFGHPAQNRAISLREAALLQSFPKKYVFCEEKNPPLVRTSRHIGNAVPVLLAKAIGASLKEHLVAI